MLVYAVHAFLLLNWELMLALHKVCGKPVINSVDIFFYVAFFASKKQIAQKLYI